MCEFSPIPSHSTLSVPDYDIELDYDYWTNNESDFGSTSFVECEIIGMDSFHKLDIPLIHLTTKSEKEDQEEYDSNCKIKSNFNTEYGSKPIIDPSSMPPLNPNIISTKHDTNPSTSNIINGDSFSFGLITDSYFGYF